MPHLENALIERILYIAAAVLILYGGFRFGAWFGRAVSGRRMAEKEQELFTAQRGFKTLYEQELTTVRSENQQLAEQVKSLTTKVEDYRRKVAGFGGLFTSGGKRADAMYALLLENEALEEALYSQNEKLRNERTDSLKEQLRHTGYRRVLISQLLSDDRIKGYVHEVLDDDSRLPSSKSLPAGNDAHRE